MPEKKSPIAFLTKKWESNQMSHTYYALAFLILIFGLAVIFISIVKLN